MEISTDLAKLLESVHYVTPSGFDQYDSDEWKHISDDEGETIKEELPPEEPVNDIKSIRMKYRKK